MTKTGNPAFDLITLVTEVEVCRACPRMENSARIFSQTSGSTSPTAMFIGEAPGRLGADRTAIPFHGDVAGHNFEALLEQAGIDRREIFVTNAVLCNPRDTHGNNATPNIVEIQTCNSFLRRQIEALNPPIVVTLGANALRATNIIEMHCATLKDAGRAFPWFGRTLIPLYHPGQRAMIHRDFSKQRIDYISVARQLPKRACLSAKLDSYALARKILAFAAAPLSYFALHKLFFLTEVEASTSLGGRLTSAYIIRQSDGPYVTNLHISKLAKRLSDLRIVTAKEKLYVSLLAHVTSPTLFAEPAHDEDYYDDFVRSVMARYVGRTDAELKVATYLTGPMKKILVSEGKAGRVLNSPIDF